MQRCLSDAVLKVEKLERISRKSARELAETSLSLAEVRERHAKAEVELAAERSARQSLARGHETMELSIRELRELLRRAHRERHCDDLIKMVMARRRALARGDATPGGFESHENAPDFGGRIPPATLPHAVERTLLELQREASGPCLDPRKGTRLIGQLRHAMLRMDAQRRGCVAAEDSVVERLVAFLEEDGTLALPRTEAGGAMRRQQEEARSALADTARPRGGGARDALRLIQTTNASHQLRERSLAGFVQRTRAEQRDRRVRGGF